MIKAIWEHLKSIRDKTWATTALSTVIWTAFFLGLAHMVGWI